MRKAARAVVVKGGALLGMHRNKFGEEYYALVYGGVGLGEAPEQTVVREVAEKTTLQIANPRLVFVEEAGVPYCNQYIFYCDYVGGEISLPADSEEAKFNELERNIHMPMWLSLQDLSNVTFLSETLKAALLRSFKQVFPNQPHVIHHSKEPIIYEYDQ